MGIEPEIGRAKETTLPTTVDATRLWRTLTDTARFGATDGGGLNRLALSPSDGEVRTWLSAAAAEAGWHEHRDEIGNQFLLRPGTDPEAGVVLIGSHLDSQPLGGRFDGVYGVLAGLEVLRTLDNAGLALRRSVVLVNWTNEEGARFSPSMMGSAVYSGALRLDEALGRKDSHGTSVAEALAELGVTATGAGKAVATSDLHAAVEIHIEQGPTLEDEGLDVGFVTGVQAIRWYDISVTGRSGHAGTTPLATRADALVSAAAIITAVAALGDDVHPDIRPTVGEVTTVPNSRNVIPGSVTLGLDIRHRSEDVLEAAEQKLRSVAASVAAQHGTAVDIETVLSQQFVSFDEGLLDRIRTLAAERGLRGRDLVSGAGHDSMQLAPHVPTAMIFIPCVDGVSHTEAEDITEAWSTNGADLLLATVLELAEVRP